MKQEPKQSMAMQDHERAQVVGHTTASWPPFGLSPLSPLHHTHDRHPQIPIPFGVAPWRYAFLCSFIM